MESNVTLTGPQLKQLHETLCSVSQSDANLQQMVRFHLDKNLRAIAGGNNLGELVFDLIKWAEQQGKVKELINAAQFYAPGNPRLQVFIRENPGLINDEKQEKSNQGPSPALIPLGAIAKTTKTEHPGPLLFISYAREDQAVAIDLYRKLKGMGFRPWIDQEDLLPGEDWDLKIRKTVRTADFLLACLSINSTAKRGYVQKELKLALDVAEEVPEGSVFLLPLRLNECAIPERLAKYQYVDLYVQGGFERLVRAISVQWNQRV